MALKINETVTINTVKIELSGVLDEHGLIPNHTGVDIIRLDFFGIKTVNSIGVRNFTRWGQIHKSVRTIRLERCPTVFAKNFSVISGFLTSNMTVVSFFVPFYSDATDETVNYEFMRDRDYTATGYTLPNLKDSKGNPMELDVPESFFGFITR